MRPEEKYTLEALVEKYGGEFYEGDDPPDGYLLNKGKKIAVEVTRLIQHVTDDNGKHLSRRADDVPAHILIDQLDKELKSKIPTDKYIFVILPTPINNFKKTKENLSMEILQLIKSAETKKLVNICSNSISISVYNGNRESGKKIIAALPNTRSSTDIGANVSYLLSDRINDKEHKRKEIDGVAEYWLALINEYWIADEQSYNISYKSLEIKHGFDRILLLNDCKDIHEIYKKT